MKRPIVQRFDGIDVVRGDLLEGGSKTRFLPFLMAGAREVVYGGPWCGGAALAFSVIGRLDGFKVTLFYAARKFCRFYGLYDTRPSQSAGVCGRAWCALLAAGLRPAASG